MTIACECRVKRHVLAAPSASFRGMDAVRTPSPSDAPPAETGRVTPMMEQFIEIKAANPDCLLFYRMGDFYELFFDDAEIASRALGIVLTKRGKHLGNDIPMCGVPVERSDEYLHKLIALGHRVAVCEQLEDPAEAKKRGGKSVVQRDVVRLVTPGTLTEDTLARRQAQQLPAGASRERGLPRAPNKAASRWPGSISPPANSASPNASRGSLAAEIARIEPGEIIVSDALYADADIAPLLRQFEHVMPLTRDVFDGATAERRLSDYFSVATTESFGPLSRLELTAAAACVTYVERTQFGKRPPLSPPLRESAGATLAIDAATRANLELIRTLSGERRGSLLVDHRPHRDRGRLAASGATARRAAHRSRRDLAAARCGRAVRRRTRRLRADIRAGPESRARSRARACRACRSGAAARAISPPSATALPRPSRCRSGSRRSPNVPPRSLRPPRRFAARTQTLFDELSAALADELPAFKRDGGFIREGYDAALDETRGLRDDSRKVIAELQARYADETGLRALKIRHNNVLGYFVEVTAQHGDKLMAPPLNARFIHRQTLAGQVRFTTTELGELEAKIVSAADRALGIELEIFERLAAAVNAVRRRHQGRGRSAVGARRVGGARDARGRARLCAARDRHLAHLRDRGRAPSGGRAGAERAVHRQRLRSVSPRRRTAPAASGC